MIPVPFHQVEIGARFVLSAAAAADPRYVYIKQGDWLYCLEAREDQQWSVWPEKQDGAIVWPLAGTEDRGLRIEGSGDARAEAAR